MTAGQAEDPGGYAQIRSLFSADPRARRTRDALREALLDLLQTHSFDQITPRQITSRAGLAHATFYRHHASKEEMLQALAREEVQSIFTNAMKRKGDQDIREAAHMLFSYVDEHRRLWSILLNGGAGNVVRDELLRMAQSQPVITPTYDSPLPPDLAVVWGTVATFELIAWWLRAGENHTIDQIVDLQLKMVIEPIRMLSGIPNDLR